MESLGIAVSAKQGRLRALSDMLTRLSRCCIMTLTQPSAIWARQMSAACRFFQSGSTAHWGSSAVAMGITAAPPNDSAMRSRHSCPNSYSSPSPSVSCALDSAWCHSGSSCECSHRCR